MLGYVARQRSRLGLSIGCLEATYLPGVLMSQLRQDVLSGVAVRRRAVLSQGSYVSLIMTSSTGLRPSQSKSSPSRLAR